MKDNQFSGLDLHMIWLEWAGLTSALPVEYDATAKENI